MMTAAFDWSPGGCCCELPGWYDAYDGAIAPALRGNRIARIPVIGQSTDPGNNSWTDIQWGIQPSTGTGEHSKIYGMQSVGQELIWSVENVPPGISTTQIDIVLYDAASQTELARFSNVPYSLNGDFSTGGGFGGAGNGTFGVTANAHTPPFSYGLLELSQANGLSFKPCPFPDPSLYSGSVYQVDSIAPRWYPKAAAHRIDSSNIGYAAFGNVTVNNGLLTITGASVVKAVADCASIAFKPFDYFNGHWSGLIIYKIRSTGFQFQSLWIDGVEIAEYQQPTSGNPATFWGWPHVAFPSSRGSQGDWYVTVPTVLWLDLPTSGITNTNLQGNGHWADQQFPMKVIVYKNGTEAWRSARCWIATSCGFSSDRWLFINTGPNTITGGQFQNNNGSIQSEFTNGLFNSGGTGWGGGQIGYMARHDGTQTVPIGKDGTTPHAMGPAMTTQGFFNGVVCNTSLLPNTAPDDLAFLATN